MHSWHYVHKTLGCWRSYIWAGKWILSPHLTHMTSSVATHLNLRRHLLAIRISSNTSRGSRINTDRFPQRAPKAEASRGVRRRPPPGNFLDFYSLKSPFLGFIVIQKGYWPDSNLESVFIIKNIFVMKNVTDFRKTVETGVDPRLNT